MQLISFVIPVFRNKDSLEPTYEQITTLFKNELSDFNYEIVFVDDGSDDGSIDKLLELRERDKQVRVFKLSRNWGQISAVQCGLIKSKGDVAIKMSADLQEPIYDIPKFIREWEKGNDIIICYRKERADSFIADNTSKFFYFLMRIGNPRMPKGGFDFYILSRRAVNQMNSINARNRFLQGDVLWMGYNVKYMPYKRLPRKIGKSQHHLWRKVKVFIDGLIYTSYLPIRLMSLFGALTAVGGLVYMIFIIINRYLKDNPESMGWASLMVLNLMIGGMIMLMLGIIGEYVWRIHDQTRNRPDFIIDKKYDND
ncbi:MAG: glycosyltransferase family 2 protein [Chitinophagales bacterium]